ncbi:protein shuttle craft [Bacillus rossius redtenbacheri]|uniref:protein shuttle craft n=1 Tax=Bacillus rossius redtenbacheri TaxID=93214 RepID=UPI002FDDFF36
MADWNSYQPEDSRYPPNFNYFPNNGRGNVHSYNGSSGIWSYPYSNDYYVSQGAYTTAVPDVSYAPIPAPIPAPYPLYDPVYEVAPTERSLAVAAASCLPPTAREFVPRSGTSYYSNYDQRPETKTRPGRNERGAWKPSGQSNGDQFYSNSGRQRSNETFGNSFQNSHSGRNGSWRANRSNWSAPVSSQHKNVKRQEEMGENGCPRGDRRDEVTCNGFAGASSYAPGNSSRESYSSAQNSDERCWSPHQNKYRSDCNQKPSQQSRVYSNSRWPNSDKYNHPRSGKERFIPKDEGNIDYVKNTLNYVDNRSSVNTKDMKSGRMQKCTVNHADDVASQADRLKDQLMKGVLECLVCCDRVRQHDSVWSCSNCFHVLHLRCTTKWARSSKIDCGWRCPACQNVTERVPSEYYCFCGKVQEPKWNRQDTPHSCGEMCGKSRADKRPDCAHRCTLLCHPGPCPPCLAQVNRNCGCGKISRVVKCGDKPLLCDAVCEKVLNCGVHKCEKTCHVGECGNCDQTIKQECHCGKEQQEVTCCPASVGVQRYSCGQACGGQLECGNHRCEAPCHPGPCRPCMLAPGAVTHCPCGKTPLGGGRARASCLDPVPVCQLACGKKLACGQPNSPHRCEEQCHSGACPPCPGTTLVRCRCGNMDREIPCVELVSRADDARCEKKCTKKRACGKHRCNQLCCIDLDHVCPLVCNHLLSCGQHRCEEPCHRGHCKPCWRSSFEELYCECGASVLYPPVPCGTRPPACDRPCPRDHPCGHPPLHTCHSQQACPPCTVLTHKHCYGKHELRKTIPCHQGEFSCGLPCNAALPCGRHRCVLPCHAGPCLREGQKCTQPCTAPRTLCGHPCSAPCHEGPCPSTPCKEMVKVTCECGHRSTGRACSDNVKEYQRIATAMLASKMADMQLGLSVDIGDILGNPNTQKMALKTLECSDECKLIERNRRMAIGLQIQNPDLSAKLTPRYSDFLRQWGKKDPQFCSTVHDKLTELVQLAKQSKQKSRSYSFQPMNRDKRHFIHEYCEHFGCESVAYDQEPKRNIVATAVKDKSWLPSMSLLEFLQRESGQRKIPKPVIGANRTPSHRAMDVLPMKYSQAQASSLYKK